MFNADVGQHCIKLKKNIALCAIQMEILNAQLNILIDTCGDNVISYDKLIKDDTVEPF